PDNVFFDNNKLCGIIDFYFACSDFLAYDLAISINAWCFDDKFAFQPALAKTMLHGYQSVRPLTTQEHAALPVLLRGAALRFLLTRLYDLLHHPEGALVKPKDPLEYVAKLKFFQSTTHAI
ncbi:MAG: phosphotransferase, partial [Alphaproteobacteria bacterium]|nr:phosphotransferase [Alphaproteobacteria bacterium]